MNGELWTQNPPLYFWLAALFAWLAGRLNEWTIRLPSALSAAELILFFYFFVRRKFGVRLAFLSTLVLATTVLTVHVARHVPINMTFYLFFILTIFFIMEILVFDSIRLSHAYGAWLFAALACMTNGAAGILIPALIVSPYLILSRRWQQALALRPFTGAILFFAVLALWAAAVAGKSPHAWSDIIFAQLGIVHHSGHASADHQFFFRFPLAFSPWAFLIVPAIISLWPNRTDIWDNSILFLSLWFLSALAFCEIVHGYHTHYVFLTFVPMALGFGVYLDRLIDAGNGAPVRLWTHRSVAMTSALFVLAGITASIVVAHLLPFLMTPTVALAVAVIFFSILIYGASRRCNDRGLIVGLAGFSVVINILLQTLLFPSLNELNGRQFAEKIGNLVNRQADTPVAILKEIQAINFFNYYSGIKRFETLEGPTDFARFLGGPAPRYLLVREGSLNVVNKAWRGHLTIVLPGTTTRGTWLLLSPCVSECNSRPSSGGP